MYLRENNAFSFLLELRWYCRAYSPIVNNTVWCTYTVKELLVLLKMSAIVLAAKKGLERFSRHVGLIRLFPLFVLFTSFLMGFGGYLS